MHLTTENTEKNHTKSTEISEILVPFVRFFSVDFVVKKNIGHAFNHGEHQEKNAHTTTCSLFLSNEVNKLPLPNTPNFNPMILKKHQFFTSIFLDNKILTTIFIVMISLSK
jgi:hypothetical protein